MAGSISTYLSNALLNSSLRDTAFPTTSGNIYLALDLTAPSKSSAGTEVSGGGYARVAITRGTGAFDAPSTVSNQQKTANTGAITFSPGPSATWGYVGWGRLMDASSGGNMFWYFPIGPETTLTAAISSTSATSMTVASATGFPSSGTFVILIDSELINVTAGAGTTTWTISRGFNGTTAATHASGVSVVQPRLISAGDSAPSLAIGTLTLTEG